MPDLANRLANRLTIRQLRLVVTVVRHNSIQRAAEELALTQPTVTKAIQEIEALLGLSLFKRVSRGVIPNQYALILCRHADLILAQLRNTGKEIQDLKDGRSGKIVVGSLLAASARLLPEAIIRLKYTCPRVSVTIVEATNDILIPQLRDGNIDFVVRRPPPHPLANERQGIVDEALYSEIACLVVRSQHPLAKAPHLELSDLLNFEWVLPQPETSLRGQIEQSFLDAGLEPPAFAIDSVSLPANFYLSTHADFVSILTYQAVRPFLATGMISILPITIMKTIGPVTISRRPEMADLSEAARTLLGHVREVGKMLHEEEREWRSIYNL